MPEAEIKINFTEVTKAQAEVRKLREEITKLSSARGAAGGAGAAAANSPLKQTGQAVQDIGNKGAPAVSKVTREIQRMTDAGRLAAQQTRAVVGQLLRFAGPVAIAGAAISLAGENMAREKSTASAAGTATGAAVAKSKLTPQQIKGLQAKYSGWLAPEKVAEIAGNTPGGIGRVERALAGEALGIGGTPSEKKIKQAEAKQAELWAMDPSFRRGRTEQRAEAIRKEMDELRANVPWYKRGSLGGEKDERWLKLAGELIKLEEARNKPGGFEPLPMREVTPSNNQGRT